MGHHRLTSVWILVFFPFFVSCSQGFGDREVADGQSLLWRVDHDDLLKPSYIFGTMHFISEEDFHLGEHLVKIARSADLIVMELDMDDINLMEYASSSLLPGGSSLTDYLDPSDYDHLRSVFVDSLGAGSFMWMAYTRMKPFFLMSEIMRIMMGEQTKSYEGELVHIAEEEGIEIVGLEDPEEQIALIDSIPLERQTEMLMKGIRSLDSVRLYLNRLITFYKHQWLDSIEFAINDPTFDDLVEFEGMLISDRNERWIAAMEDLMQHGMTLFAVGAAHLPGEAGVLNLLRQKGYGVTAVRTE